MLQRPGQGPSRKLVKCTAEVNGECGSAPALQRLVSRPTSVNTILRSFEQLPHSPAMSSRSGNCLIDGPFGTVCVLLVLQKPRKHSFLNLVLDDTSKNLGGRILKAKWPQVLWQLRCFSWLRQQQ